MPFNMSIYRIPFLLIVLAFYRAKLQQIIDFDKDLSAPPK